MKKYFIFALTIILTTLIVLADDAKFAYALKNCSSYSESGSVQTDGINVTSSKKILGWQGDKCVYQEKVKKKTFFETSLNPKFKNDKLNKIFKDFINNSVNKFSLTKNEKFKKNIFIRRIQNKN